MEEAVEHFHKQVSEVIPQQIDRFVEEVKSKDPETAEKIKKLKAELSELKGDILKLYEEIKKPVLEKFNEVKDEVAIKTKPIIKRYTPIVKDLEVSVKNYILYTLILYLKQLLLFYVFRRLFWLSFPKRRKKSRKIKTQDFT